MITNKQAEKAQSPLKNIDYILLTGLLLIALAARLIPGLRIVDDAYITFRYARNIVTGYGFVYNPGEHVLGTTTPLYTLLMAGLAWISGSRDFPLLAFISNACFGAISAAMLYLLVKRLASHSVPAAVVTLLWAMAPFSITFAIGGMETDLAIALLIACAYAHLAQKPRVLAILSALALLTRPDTAILLGLLWLDLIIAERRIPWREGLITLALLAPWLIYGTLTFGSPLTNSIAAKSLTYRLPPTADLIRLTQHYATPFFETKVLPPMGVVVLFAIYLGLCTLGSLRTLRHTRRAWPMIAYPLAYFIVFAVANPLLFRWYFSPPLPFYFMLILTGAWVLANDLDKFIGKNRSQVRYALFAVPAILTLALTLNAWTLHPDHGPDRPAPEMAWFKLEQIYAQAADLVLADAGSQSDVTLCAGDIGVLGYTTDFHILDTVGLVTPQSSEHYPADPEIYVINYAIPADLVLALDPDYIVILEVYGREGLLPDPRFQAQYRLLESIETDIYGSESMLIFTRQ